MSAIGLRRAEACHSDFCERNSSTWNRMLEVYGSNGEILESRRSIFLQALKTYTETYGGDREVLISRAPARINLLGNHIDHRGGSLNYMAINRETVMVASPRNDDRVVAHNANEDRFPPRAFRIGELLPPGVRGNWLDYINEAAIEAGDWGNLIRAPILYLQDQRPDRSLRGMDLAVAGDIPIAAGLSSSSALVVATLEAVLTANDMTLPREEKAEFCGRAEWYVGTRGGSGDHAAILYGRKGAILSVQFFPLRMTEVPFPEGYRVVSCNSCVEHHDASTYNERVATYEIGLRLITDRFPQHAPKLPHLRDLTSANLELPLEEIYRILKTLPERIWRRDILSRLPESRPDLERLFSPHEEPAEGYRVRQAVFFGLAECARASLCRDLLGAGDVEGFGKLKYLSHDGDRRVRFTDTGDAVPVDNGIDDAAIDRLIADLESGDVNRTDRAQIHKQPGGYDCSCEELDFLVDTASRVDGVVGAGLTGGGLGGCVLAVVRDSAVDELLSILNREFYQPRGLQDGTVVCTSVDGACVL